MKRKTIGTVLPQRRFGGIPWLIETARKYRHMDQLDQLADIGRQIAELRSQSRDATVRYDWAKVDRINQKIADLMKRQKELSAV